MPQGIPMDQAIKKLLDRTIQSAPGVNIPEKSMVFIGLTSIRAYFARHPGMALFVL